MHTDFMHVVYSSNTINRTKIIDAIGFVSNRSKEKLKSSANNNEDNKESNEPGYDEDEDQLEEKQE
jgi:hypothetical protein